VSHSAPVFLPVLSRRTLLIAHEAPAKGLDKFLPHLLGHVTQIGRIKYDRDAPTAAARAAQALRDASKRKISASRADQRSHVQSAAITAFPLVFQPSHPVVEAAHVDAPPLTKGLAEGLDRHGNKLRTRSILWNARDA
jgi:hypothetical protein